MLDCTLRIDYPKFQLDVAFVVPRHSVYCLYGPSGSGKSTILAALIGLIKPTKSRIVYDGVLLQDDHGQKIAPWRRSFSMIEQVPKLFPHMTLAQNIAFAAGKRTLGDEEQKLIAQFDLTDRLRYKPHQLSGGFQQQGAFVRALATKPKLLLLDEPFFALDWQFKEQMIRLFAAYREQNPVTTIFVTHDLREAQRLADRIGILQDGRILRDDRMDAVFSQPQTMPIAKQMGYTSFLSAEKYQHPGQQYLAIHPDRLIVRKKGIEENGILLGGTIVAMTAREGFYRIEIQLELGDHVQATVRHEHTYSVGEKVVVDLGKAVYVV